MPGINLTSDEFKELTEKAYKYDRLSRWLKEYIDDPDDETEVIDLCVRAGSDDTLDEVMDMAGVDTLDDLHYKINEWMGNNDYDSSILAEIDRLKNSSELTDPSYWDCKCKTNFIHPKSEHVCDNCGAHYHEGDPDYPDSRATEVAAWLKKRLSRAEILCAMDVLMHHLSDEDSIEPWLANGMPDGLDTDILNPRASRSRLDDYLEYGNMSDDEFEEIVKLFATIVRKECFKVKDGKFEYQRKGFC